MDDLFAYELLVQLVGAIQMIYFFYNLMPAKVNNARHRIIYIILLILAYSMIPTINYMSIIYMGNNTSVLMTALTSYISAFSYPIIFGEGSLAEKLFFGSFYISMTTLLTVVTAILCSSIFNVTYMDVIMSEGYERIIFLILTKVVHFIFIKIILRYMEFTKYLDNKSLYMRSIALIFDEIILFTAVRYTIIYSAITTTDLAVITFFLFLIQIISIYGMDIFSKEMKIKFIILEELNHKRYENHIINMYEEMKAWRHDFRNHMSVVSGLLNLGETNKAIEYINDVEGMINKFDTCIYTDNIVIDSLLSNKINLAKEKNIKINIRIDMSSEIKIPNIDICTIIGNLMDNSIEACDKFEGDKFIDIIIISSSNQLIIRMKNSSKGFLKKVRGRFVSTKEKDRHGFGLIQIDSVVKKFNGYINRKYSENIFDTYIKIEYM